jgi:hypothetical protein
MHLLAFFWWDTKAALNGEHDSSTIINEDEFATMLAENRVLIAALLSLLVVAVSTAVSPVEAFSRIMSGTKSKLLVPVSSLGWNGARQTGYFFFLEDLQHPFRLHEKFPIKEEEHYAENESLHQEYHHDTLPVTHFCFLIHGHRGLSRDLQYLHAVLERFGALEQQKKSRSHQSMRRKDTLIVHNCVSNEGRTHDGVAAGGDRVVEEMLEVIRSEMNKLPFRGDTDSHEITISILGNSLGGLFGRYAIAKLIERHCVRQEDDAWLLDGKYRLHLNVFCSTASPHLGVASNTYFRVPRSAEVAVAHTMGETGKDLFRLNDLIRTMSTCPTYLGPLSSFRKRIAVANAHNTDFPVPASTAAFLSVNSTYPHNFTTFDDEYDNDRRKSMIVATLRTPSERELRSMLEKEQKEDREEEKYVEKHVDELHEMSESLDKLGWKKIFVDMRDELPSLKIPKVSIPLLSKQQKTQKAEDFQSLRALGETVSSKDLSEITSQKDNRFPLPMGHNMVIAFSRSPLSTYMNKGGRPIVDTLARDLVKDIFSWEPTPEQIQINQ